MKLFTASAYDRVNDDRRGWTHSVISGPALVPIAHLAPELSRCAAMTEPGLLSFGHGSFNGACSYLAAKQAPGLLIGRLQFVRPSAAAVVSFHIYRTSVTPELTPRRLGPAQPP